MSTNQITETSTGAGSSILNTRKRGDSERTVLQATGVGAWNVDIQVGPEWDNVLYDGSDVASKVTLDSAGGPRTVDVKAGLQYRMFVNTVGTSVTLKELQT